MGTKSCLVQSAEPTLHPNQATGGRDVGMAGLNPITAAHPAARAGGTPDPSAALSFPDQDSLQNQSAEDLRLSVSL